jgi:hypothetical protein
MILPVVMYGCETLLHIMRKERRFSVFKNRVLRRGVWPNRDEVKKGVEKIT